MWVGIRDIIEMANDLIYKKYQTLKQYVFVSFNNFVLLLTKTNYIKVKKKIRGDERRSNKKQNKKQNRFCYVFDMQLEVGHLNRSLVSPWFVICMRAHRFVCCVYNVCVNSSCAEIWIWHLASLVKLFLVTFCHNLTGLSVPVVVSKETHEDLLCEPVFVWDVATCRRFG